MNNKPFLPGSKVIVVDPMSWGDMKKGDVFTVIDSAFLPCGCGVVNVGLDGGTCCQRHSIDYSFSGGRNYLCFAPYKPYSNSVSKELAEKAMSVGDGADQPIKIKEPALN